MEDDLRPEYDLRKLQMRKVGLRRRDFGGLTVFLEPDVADIFPDRKSFNEKFTGSFQKTPNGGFQ